LSRRKRATPDPSGEAPFTTSKTRFFIKGLEGKAGKSS